MGVKFKLCFENNFKPIHVDDWKDVGKDEKVKAYSDGLYIEFDQIFGIQGQNSINNFNMRKKLAYLGEYTKSKKKGEGKKREMLLFVIRRYINYFIKFYDKDNELLMGYLKIKYIIDTYPTTSEEELFELIEKYIFTKTMIRKIEKMTKDNYILNLKEESDAKSKKTGQKFDDRIKMTDFHAKIFYSISTAYKIIAPILTHYAKVTNVKRIDVLLYPILLKVFHYFEKDVNVYNKLRIYSESRVNSIRNPNSKIIEKREIEEGKDLDDAIDFILNKLINGNIIKAVFNENIIKLIYVVLKNQADTTIISGKPLREIIPVESDQGGDEEEAMSGADKIEIFMSKVDEGNIIKSKKNIKSTIDKLKIKFNVKISVDEYNYYKDNLIFSNTQRDFMNLFYSKYFKSSKEILTVNKRQYIELSIILKKYLISLGYKILPYCIVGNIEDKSVKNVKINKKMLDRLRDSHSYNILLDRYRDSLTEAEIIDIMTKTLNKKFTIVDYNLQDNIGEIVDVDEIKLIKELISYLLLI